jgi:hypothetical protein
MPRITGERTTSAAAVNRKAAEYFLELARKTEEGQLYTTVTSLIHSAFTHEAFLNSLGPKVISFWDELDRLPVAKKLKIICKRLGYRPDYGSRPYQTLGKLFRFRNRLAHGRDEVVRVEGKEIKVASDIDYFNILGPDWEKYSTVENAANALEDITAIANDLSERAGIEKFLGYPFGSLGSGSWHIHDSDT